MPDNKQNIKITSNLVNTDIDNLQIQEAPKYLLRCMKQIGNNNIVFTYEDLVLYMKVNKDTILYKGKNKIKSIKNIENYWNYAKSHKTAYIPNFDDYYIFN